MRNEADCTSVVLLLGDPFTVADELAQTLAGLKFAGPRFEVLLVCDGPAWRRQPAVQSFLVHGPRPGLLQTRSCVDHPAPLLNLALDWLRTPYCHLVWPGASYPPGQAESLCDLLEQYPDAALAQVGDPLHAHAAVLRVSSLRAAGGFDPAPMWQTALGEALATLGETVRVDGTVEEPRWNWVEYPFLKRWPGRISLAA